MDIHHAIGTLVARTAGDREAAEALAVVLNERLALRAVAEAARSANRTGGFPYLTDALAALDALPPATEEKR